MYQGFSLSFDASSEEVWLAFHAGATLVAATPEMVRARRGRASRRPVRAARSAEVRTEWRPAWSALRDILVRFVLTA